MNRVWVLGRNGQGYEESFTDTMESVNFAKQRSLRAMCAFRYSNKKLYVYENGEIATPSRAKDLSEVVRELLINDTLHEVRVARGKRSPKKV